ncbi:MAG: hypothetical protein AAFQ07_19770 [Chloroflexota bacterium]
MQRHELELRNVPRNRVMEYLVEAGGTEDGELAVQGDGWRGWLEELEPVKIITMTVRRDMLIIEGEDPDTVNEVRNFMRRKTMRGGG